MSSKFAAALGYFSATGGMAFIYMQQAKGWNVSDAKIAECFAMAATWFALAAYRHAVERSADAPR